VKKHWILKHTCEELAELLLRLLSNLKLLFGMFLCDFIQQELRILLLSEERRGQGTVTDIP